MSDTTTPRDTTEAEALAAKEHARHHAQYSTVYDGRGGIKWEDKGGLCCSCGEWDAPMDEARKVRPWGAWHRHVVAAVLASPGLAARDAAQRAEGAEAALREGTERAEAVLRIALSVLDRQAVTKGQDTYSDGIADGVAAVVEPLAKTLGYANTGTWLRSRPTAKRCDDDLHEHTLLEGVFVCRECWGFPEQPPTLGGAQC